MAYTLACVEFCDSKGRFYCVPIANIDGLNPKHARDFNANRKYHIKWQKSDAGHSGRYEGFISFLAVSQTEFNVKAKERKIKIVGTVPKATTHSLSPEKSKSKSRSRSTPKASGGDPPKPSKQQTRRAPSTKQKHGTSADDASKARQAKFVSLLKNKHDIDSKQPKNKVPGQDSEVVDWKKKFEELQAKCAETSQSQQSKKGPHDGEGGDGSGDKGCGDNVEDLDWSATEEEDGGNGCGDRGDNREANGDGSATEEEDGGNGSGDEGRGDNGKANGDGSATEEEDGETKNGSGNRGDNDEANGDESAMEDDDSGNRGAGKEVDGRNVEEAESDNEAEESEEDSVFNRVLDDLKEKKRLEERKKNKVYLGKGLHISKQQWEENIRVAPTDKKFTKNLGVSLWTTEDLKKRTVCGKSKRVGMKKATPKKVDAILDAARARFTHAKVPVGSQKPLIDAVKKDLNQKMYDAGREDDPEYRAKVKKWNEDRKRKKLASKGGSSTGKKKKL